ncbi:uncharacterized protein BT62DRAFT_1073955 [Guyanagaster necrorhizus]|uniref:O-methyltransferase n=1 Tax=Guyanagaster necrorhizus TaxID=856835 RepID=A0A9P8AUL6_9AGAR|nr:uncharacterized protein BT62DRAFT_1073955 [Guyanagaster necrorhizus MCA 3950]KAG7448370.1 hypothetical protein BT62DRAFT_1073955 [Guyanagaster necrorhizus MCA 3950]
MASHMRALLHVLQGSIERIEKECQRSGVEFPVLDEPYMPDSKSIRLTPAVQEASIPTTATAYQLIAVVQRPQMHVFNAGCSYYLSASLRAAIETNAVEILREAGPKGLHVTKIAAQSNVDHMKFSRIMRFLATHHIFKEISPDVYANNRLSSICDTGKPVAELLDRPLEKYDGTNGIAALIGHCTDEDYKGAGYITEHLTNPEMAFEDSPERSPMMQAFGCDVGVWNWLEKPSNQLRLQRFGVAMDGVSRMRPQDSILKGFDWGYLPNDSIVVDVGGGIGVSSITLVKAHRHIRCIIQDMPSVVAQGKKVDIPGANSPAPPAPLLANMGTANASPYFTDLSMYVHFTGQDRTLAHIVGLLNGAGWAMERVHPGDSIGNYLPQIIATPA